MLETNASQALKILPASDRETIVRWLSQLGLDLEQMEACPPMARLVEMLACCNIVASLCPPLSREVAWQRASAMLELGDPLRTWYRWQRNACDIDARICQDDIEPIPSLNIDTHSRSKRCA